MLVACGWAAVGAGVVMLGAVSVPTMGGFRQLTVMSGSMSPTIETGDVVVTKTISPLAARVGDIVTFSDPANPGHLITHRVRRMQVTNAGVEFETKGDANNTTENWNVAVKGRIGRVMYRVRAVGYALSWSRTPYWRLVMVALPSMVLGALTLAWAWRDPTEKVRAPAGLGGLSTEVVG